jgi:hypothetical protein
MVVYGTPVPLASATPVVPGLTTSKVNVIVQKDIKAAPDRVTVEVDQFEINAVFAQYTLRRKPRCSFEYQGRYITP